MAAGDLVGELPGGYSCEPLDGIQDGETAFTLIYPEGINPNPTDLVGRIISVVDERLSVSGTDKPVTELELIDFGAASDSRDKVRELVEGHDLANGFRLNWYLKNFIDPSNQDRMPVSVIFVPELEDTESAQIQILTSSEGFFAVDAPVMITEIAQTESMSNTFLA